MSFIRVLSSYLLANLALTKCEARDHFPKNYCPVVNNNAHNSSNYTRGIKSTRGWHFATNLKPPESWRVRLNNANSRPYTNRVRFPGGIGPKWTKQKKGRYECNVVWGRSVLDPWWRNSTVSWGGAKQTSRNRPTIQIQRQRDVIVKPNGLYILTVRTGKSVGRGATRTNSVHGYRSAWTDRTRRCCCSGGPAEKASCCVGGSGRFYTVWGVDLCRPGESAGEGRGDDSAAGRSTREFPRARLLPPPSPPPPSRLPR